MTVAVTVLLPVYNGEAYLREAIESILSQSYADFELLVIDDGSTDQTPEILAHYAAVDPRVRVLQHYPNRGVAFALDRGLNEAHGLFVAQIGADDEALPGRLQKQVDFLTSNPDYVLVGGYLRIIDARGRAIGLRRYPATDAQLRTKMLLYNPFGAPSVMFRKKEALAAGGFTVRFWTCEDYDFILRLAQRGKIANLCEPLTSYRLHDNAIKATQTSRQLLDTVRTKRTAYKEYGYRETASARFLNFAQDVAAHLPGGLSYWLFTKFAIKRVT
jgi:glycosyltransferase involved in cell wall biosynthesis